MTDFVEDDTEFTELVDANVPRVDLVGMPANGVPGFLVMKQDAQGLLDPDLIRDLIGKSTSEPEPPPEDKVTMTGSPAAIAKLIHAAAQRADSVTKDKYDTDDRERMADSGAAMADGSYPIADRADLERAIHAVGRGGADHDAIRRHVIARAKALGASSEIPDNWNADGSLKGAVAKEMNMDDDALDATTALAEPEIDAPGNPTTPGSPAWEAIDAATACKWTAILARAKNAVGLLADREMLEAAAGDDCDAMQAMDLEDAACAIDYAISVLAPFAVAEHAEAECGEEMQAVGKALAGLDTQALDTIEALGQVRKAGRVLSSANEAAIRGAVESLQKVLASLPAAPTTDDSGQPVAKEQETDMPEPTPAAEVVADAGETPEMGVAKADGEKTPMCVVYDQKGRLIGIVDPADVTPVANSEAEPDDTADDKDGAEDGDKPADGDATPETTDLTPAPAAEVGTPADAVDDDEAVTKSTNETDTASDVLKSIAAVVKEALDAHGATQGQALAKAEETIAQMAETVETLKGQVKALEEQPAAPKVFTNGAVPPAHLLRGQDSGAGRTVVDMAQAQELRKGLYSADAGEQNRAAINMQELAIAKLAEIRQSH